MQKIKERDQLREELKEMTEARTKLEKERTMQNIENKQIIDKMRD